MAWARVALAVALSVLGTACAGSAGWTRTHDRACEPRTAPQVCLAADPDRPVRMVVGDEELVPGECVRAPRGGGVRVRIIDGRGSERRRGVHLRRGTRKTVHVGDGLRVRVSAVRCDRSVPDDAPP